MVILFFRNWAIASYWFKYVISMVPAALVLSYNKLILRINNKEIRFCGTNDYQNIEMIKLGQPKDTKFFYGTEDYFEADFYKALERILK